MKMRLANAHNGRQENKKNLKRILNKLHIFSPHNKIPLAMRIFFKTTVKFNTSLRGRTHHEEVFATKSPFKGKDAGSKL